MRREQYEYEGVQDGQEEPDELHDMVENDLHATTVITEGIHDLANQPLITGNDNLDNELMNDGEITLGNTTAERLTADKDKSSNETNDDTEESYRHLQDDGLEANNEEVAHHRRYQDRIRKSPVCFITMRRTHNEDELTTKEALKGQ